MTTVTSPLATVTSLGGYFSRSEFASDSLCLSRASQTFSTSLLLRIASQLLVALSWMITSLLSEIESLTGVGSSPGKNVIKLFLSAIYEFA